MKPPHPLTITAVFQASTSLNFQFIVTHATATFYSPPFSSSHHLTARFHSTKKKHIKNSGVRGEATTMAHPDEQIQAEIASKFKNSTTDKMAEKSGVTLTYKRKSK